MTQGVRRVKARVMLGGIVWKEVSGQFRVDVESEFPEKEPHFAGIWFYRERFYF